MKPVRIVMTIFFIILSSFNFHKLLTEGSYRGGKVYVVATTQSIIMQILLIIGLILYLIYLLRVKEYYKPSYKFVIPKNKKHKKTNKSKSKQKSRRKKNGHKNTK